MNVDYRGLQALFTVLDSQSFEVAAKKLCITQSAVSQRIKSVENFYGTPLLIRSTPYKPTQLGEYLMGHYKRTLFLEQVLSRQLEDEIAKTKISIAVNTDSLESWFMDFVEENDIFDNVVMEVIVHDETITLDYLRKGIVDACLSNSSKALNGCKSTFLGFMDYVLVASPEFKKKYFGGKDCLNNLLNAPAVIYDRYDQLHTLYLEEFFKCKELPKQCHIIPSLSGLRQFALKGMGYVVISKNDVEDDLRNKSLVQLYETKILKIPLYWHSWAIEIPIYKTFNRSIIEYARQKLRYADSQCE